MRFKSLQFGKAMSAALFVLLLVVVGMTNALAQNQVATLQHGEDISVYYGMNAFVEAHTAAADGDIVTLSGGRFTPPSEITKAITLRGAGVVVDTVAGTNPTIINGSVCINVSNDSIAFEAEGIVFGNSSSGTTNTTSYRLLINPKFTKCNFYTFSYNNESSNMVNAQLINCIIKTFNSKYATNTAFINSIVWSPQNITDSHTVILYNSIFGVVINASNLGAIKGVLAYNSVVVRGTTNSSSSYGNTSYFVNCICIKLGSYAFDNANTSNCVIHTSYADVFESFTGSFSYEELFVLKDEIATEVLGNDGTQVGIYGGMMPYSNRPSYMVLKRCNVANKSTIDGKLSVDIEVITEGE